ncbi:MAG: GNAT family N-acetyltransferase [Streptosporangiaceae bacterium]
MSIRKFRLDDEYAVYDICLRTGEAGADASDLYEDPRLLGHVYAGAYLRFTPEFASVVEEGAVLGYVLGAPDTREFERRCEQEWWPQLRRRYADPVAPATPDERLMQRIHHPGHAREDLLGQYPSHLHIDLLPQAQGKGYGRSLMEALLEELAATGSPGVHLGIDARNAGAQQFYPKLGFGEVYRDEHVVLMARDL